VVVWAEEEWAAWEEWTSKLPNSNQLQDKNRRNFYPEVIRLLSKSH
jgi:hypothetical protein